MHTHRPTHTPWATAEVQTMPITTDDMYAKATPHQLCERHTQPNEGLNFNTMGALILNPPKP